MNNTAHFTNAYITIRIGEEFLTENSVVPLSEIDALKKRVELSLARALIALEEQYALYKLNIAFEMKK